MVRTPVRELTTAGSKAKLSDDVVKPIDHRLKFVDVKDVGRNGRSYPEAGNRRWPRVSPLRRRRRAWRPGRTCWVRFRSHRAVRRRDTCGRDSATAGGGQLSAPRFRFGTSGPRGICRPNGNEPADHRQAQGPAPAQHFRHLAFAPDVRNQVFGNRSAAHPAAVGRIGSHRSVGVGASREPVNHRAFSVQLGGLGRRLAVGPISLPSASDVPPSRRSAACATVSRSGWTLSAIPCFVGRPFRAGGWRLAGALAVHRLQMLDPALQAAVSFHQLIANAPDFVDDYITAHESRLLKLWPRLTLGIDSGDTSNGARNECRRQIFSRCN